MKLGQGLCCMANPLPALPLISFLLSKYACACVVAGRSQVCLLFQPALSLSLSLSPSLFFFFLSCSTESRFKPASPVARSFSLQLSVLFSLARSCGLFTSLPRVYNKRARRLRLWPTFLPRSVSPVTRNHKLLKELPQPPFVTLSLFFFFLSYTSSRCVSSLPSR